MENTSTVSPNRASEGHDGLAHMGYRQLFLATMAFAISFSVWGLIAALAPGFKWCDEEGNGRWERRCAGA
jgi:hypothetical protein